MKKSSDETVENIFFGSIVAMLLSATGIALIAAFATVSKMAVLQ